MMSLSRTPALTITVSCDEDVALVSLGGRLDAETIEVVQGELEALLEAGVRELLIEMARTEFLDDAAARSLVEAARWTRALGGTLHVFHVHGQPRELLERLDLRVAGPLLTVRRAV